MKVQYVNREDTKRCEVVDLNLVDQKGRKIGMFIKRYATDIVEVDEKTAVWWMGGDYEPGAYFAAYVHVTRNTNTYGASQKNQYFKTEKEREEFIQKRIASSRKKYAKQFAAYNKALEAPKV